MTLKFVSFSMGLALILAFAMPGSASAQVRKDVSEYAGQRCSTPPRGSGVIFGQFSGVDDSPFIGSDGLVPVDRMRCFATMSECKGWLYTMQSKYTNAGTARIVRCMKR
ncbi:metallophosphoesterase [Brucella sp. BE17]|uniref:metallophosphoesterase n=1 Tax=Brucella sp. BE17 TaxID=3142977 RepID=UPI0031BB064C